MANKTYYGKLDCYSSVANNAVLADEMHKGCLDFLSYLSSSNVVELVTWNSGSGAAAATFVNRTYSGGSFPFGPGAFSVWKFKANALRNWDWYLYLQLVSNTAGSWSAIKYNWTNPITGSGDGVYNSGDNFLNSGGGGTVTARGILMQAALCVSGTTSFNPWNGSISQGAANASTGAGNGGVRWVSGSNDRRLYVLPRSNDAGGTHVLQKANGSPLMVAPESTTTARYHFFYDGDALLIMNDAAANSTYTCAYVGGFEARSSLTGSGFCGSDLGFTMYAVSPTAAGSTVFTNTLSYAAKFGDTAGNGTVTFQNGGIALPIKAAVSGSKQANLNILTTWSDSTYQPNTLINKYEEFPILLGADESPFLGFLGTFNTGLMRSMRDVQVHDTTADFSRAVFGGTTTVSDLKISTPWTGSNPPGISTDRTGSQFTWIADYR